MSARGGFVAPAVVEDFDGSVDEEDGYGDGEADEGDGLGDGEGHGWWWVECGAVLWLSFWLFLRNECLGEFRGAKERCVDEVERETESVESQTCMVDDLIEIDNGLMNAGEINVGG